jgi:hypothetical protein
MSAVTPTSCSVETGKRPQEGRDNKKALKGHLEPLAGDLLDREEAVDDVDCEEESLVAELELEVHLLAYR